MHKWKCAGVDNAGAMGAMGAGERFLAPFRRLFLVHNYHWCYPGVFWAMAALVIVKQFFIPEKWKSLGLSLLVALVANFAANGAIQALYRPIFDMLQKLSK